MKQAIAGAARVFELALEIGRMHFRDDATGIGMELGVADNAAAGAGSLDATHRRVEPLRVLRMSDACVVAMED